MEISKAHGNLKHICNFQGSLGSPFIKKLYFGWLREFSFEDLTFLLCYISYFDPNCLKFAYLLTFVGRKFASFPSAYCVQNRCVVQIEGQKKNRHLVHDGANNDATTGSS